MKRLLLFLLLVPLVIGAVNIMVTLVDPLDDAVVSSGPVVLKCSVSKVPDFDGKLSNLSLYNDFGGSFELRETYFNVDFGEMYEFSVDDVSEGVYTWSCEAVDNSSNSYMGNEYSLIVDDGVPSITFVSPLNETYNSTSLDLEVDLVEENVDECLYSLNKDSNETFDCLSVVALEGVLEGSNILEVFVTDVVGNFNSSLVEFYVVEQDTSFPIVSSIDVDYDYEGDDNVTISLNVVTDENATCRYDVQDDSYEGMSLMNVTGALSHSNSEFFDVEKNGTYYVLCSDGSGNVMNSSVSVNYTIEFVTPMLHEWAEVHAGQSLVYSLNGVIDKILVKVKNDLADVGVDVNEVEVVPIAYDGKVYKYFEVSWRSLTDSDVESAKVVFSLPLSWLESNGLTRDDIRLFRYTDSWSVLDTSFVRKEGEDYVFEANVPGFSYFAIGVPVVSVVDDGSDVVEEVSGNVVASETLVSDEDSDWSFSPWLLLGLVGFVLVLCVGVYVYEHRKDLEKE